MKQVIIMVSMALLVATLLCGNVLAGPQEGPAPHSGDGVSDGPGWDDTHWPDDGNGPAPNSGDGIPDGPGW